MENKLRPNAQVYALRKGDVETDPSTVVTNQLPIANLFVYALVDSRASHSYLAARIVEK